VDEILQGLAGLRLRRGGVLLIGLVADEADIVLFDSRFCAGICAHFLATPTRAACAAALQPKVNFPNRMNTGGKTMG
jgi:hypothetical protein